MAANPFRKSPFRFLGVLVKGASIWGPSYSKSISGQYHLPMGQQSFQRPPYVLNNRWRHCYATDAEEKAPILVTDTPDEIVQAAQQLSDAETVPEETTVLSLLSKTQKLVCSTPQDLGSENEGSTFSTRQAAIERLSKSVYEVVSSPNVFITSKILETFVSIQSALGCPETLVPIFEQYASKPIPQPGTNPVRYQSQNPRKITAAIPFSIARMAIDAAAKSRNLPICFDIIMNTVCTTAYKRNQWARRGTLPVTAALLAPVAAWQIATYYGTFQHGLLDPDVARVLAFAGILTYFGATSTLGYIAVTTSNDQMQRVTWIDGTPLHERWIREDERALLDQVALRWGYQEKSRRGEEEGQDWEALREWIGVRGMMLDRVSLMEGME